MANELFSLGEIWVSDFLSNGEQPRAGKHELKLILDESCGTARLATTTPVDKMFGRYWYISGTNTSMKIALKDIVDSILPHVKNHLSWLDIASNDGTLLSYVPITFDRNGVDPYEGDEASKYGRITKDYFKASLFDKQYFSVITCVAMFYDLEDPDIFCKDVYEVLDDEGLFVIQQSYTPFMIKQLAFDNILSEHVYYHTLNSMKIILERNGFEIVDCTLNDVNGGSFRLFVKKKGASFANQPYRHVCQYRISSYLRMEKYMRLEDPMTWMMFYHKCVALKNKITDFIKHETAKGKTIMGYGASTKGNTLLQWFGLTSKQITAIADRQQKKWGLHTVGTNIPIISEDEMRTAQPDYLLVLPWHFIQSFKERESEYLKKGGKLIVPMPKFEVLGL